MNLPAATHRRLTGARVLVAGLGSSGYSAARALLELDAKVRVTESSDSAAVAWRAEELRAAGAEVEIGSHDLEQIDADLAVVSPGIPPHSPVISAVVARGIEIWSEIELAYRLAECEFLAVTGTNGKTTTTTLLTAMLREAGMDPIAAGNIGLPLVDAVGAAGSEKMIVAEVSSFQLAYIVSFKPRVSVLLNIAEDHTDWHLTLDAYARAKARITENQDAGDAFIFNQDDKLAAHASSGSKAKLVPFSSTGLPKDGIGVRDGHIVWRSDTVLQVDEVTLPGAAGLEDVVAAAGAALEYGADAGAVRRAVKGFTALSHRLEVVAEAGGITYIDDSKATNPHATLAALRGMRDVVLIAGGRSKGMDLGSLAEGVPPVIAVIAIGEAADEIERVFSDRVPVEIAGDMDDAVRLAGARSVAGGSVLLSPGCASLDMYAGYAARGEAFAHAVKSLLDGSSSEGER
jgi:UDP-N-acetylmuramoylalanine--D-glutamate ligase